MGDVESITLCKGTCPRCGLKGIAILKKIRGREYIYFRHGKKWCYIGPLHRLSPELILRIISCKLGMCKG